MRDSSKFIPVPAGTRDDKNKYFFRKLRSLAYIVTTNVLRRISDCI